MVLNFRDLLLSCCIVARANQLCHISLFSSIFCRRHLRCLKRCVKGRHIWPRLSLSTFKQILGADSIHLSGSLCTGFLACCRTHQILLPQIRRKNYISAFYRLSNYLTFTDLRSSFFSACLSTEFISFNWSEWADRVRLNVQGVSHNGSLMFSWYATPLPLWAPLIRQGQALIDSWYLLTELVRWFESCLSNHNTFWHSTWTCQRVLLLTRDLHVWLLLCALIFSTREILKQLFLESLGTATRSGLNPSVFVLSYFRCGRLGLYRDWVLITQVWCNCSSLDLVATPSSSTVHLWAIPYSTVELNSTSVSWRQITVLWGLSALQLKIFVDMPHVNCLQLEFFV